MEIPSTHRNRSHDVDDDDENQRKKQKRWRHNEVPQATMMNELLRNAVNENPEKAAVANILATNPHLVQVNEIRTVWFETELNYKQNTSPSIVIYDSVQRVLIADAPTEPYRRRQGEKKSVNHWYDLTDERGRRKDVADNISFYF
jgi:hypothetical protein